MSQITEVEILDRMVQALGEARRAAQKIARNADPDVGGRLIGRGVAYGELRTAVELVEGGARQIAQWRSDAHWVKLGFLYGRIRMALQPKYASQKWTWFRGLDDVFRVGEQTIRELHTKKTGKLSSQPILPENPESWLKASSFVPVLPQMSRMKSVN